MVNNYNKNEMIINKTVSLNANEVYIVRLVSHGLTTVQITDFLAITTDQYLNYIKSIKLKLECESWFRAVLKSFKLGILKHEDFIDELVKVKALNYSFKLLKIVNEQKQTLEFVTLAIISFFEDSEKVFLELNTMEFLSQEINYLQLKFKGFDHIEMSKSFNFSESESFDFQERLFRKLEVNDWYNAFKKAFKLKIIDIDTNLNTNHFNEAGKVATNILAISLFKSLTEKEKQLMIYNELLKYYALVEFSCLSHVQLV